MNAVEIEEAVSLLAEEPFDAENFPYAFLVAFGNKATTIKRLRSGTTNKSDLGGVLQTNNIHIAPAPRGEVPQILAALRNSPASTRAKVKFVLATDGESLEAEDMNSGETIACAYADFANYFGFFLPLAGITTVKQVRENSFDIKATARLNRLYVQLLQDNPHWADADRREDMNHFMARLIFCFFAEDTSIFRGKDLFTDTINKMSTRDASNTHEVIGETFRAMKTPPKERPNADLPRWASAFPYVNGGLFSDSTEVPCFTKIARSYLLHIGNLDWTKINPDIFGSMIQAVADDEERGELGMHYTSVPNILKVLNPLFLDDLKTHLVEAGDNMRKLLNLRKRIAHIRVFDPACGSGNFLVIAYKEMRAIENTINERRGERGRKSEIPLTNFRGIELRHFSSEVARLALIIAEYQCNVTYLGQKEALIEFLPLEANNWITCGNALRLDWLSICPATGADAKYRADDLFEKPLDQAEIDFDNEGGETYICGNPPYLGSKKKTRTQADDMSRVGLAKAQLLDYVAAFIVKGVEMVDRTDCSIALVSTSSICQGEQVALLWPLILDRTHINFAYTPFRWANSAANNAGVFCTIIGLSTKEARKKRLYSKSSVQYCDSIAPYLISGPQIICTPRKTPLSNLSTMQMGSNAVDGKTLILEDEQRARILENYPNADKFIYRYGGTKEMLSGVCRWCVWVSDHDLEEAQQIPPLRRIIDNCRAYRLGAGRDARKAAARPHAFCYSTYRHENFLQVGNTIGNRLAYVPVEVRSQGFVSNHNAFVVYGAPLVEFSIIVSSLHWAWAETIAGRLGNGIRYGNTIVYNTFPVPSLTRKNKADLARCSEAILLARESHFPITIADLYDPATMPDNLRIAHERNDEVLERIYIGRRFANNTERLEKLFELYTEKTLATRKGRGQQVQGAHA